jgi:hypothetical protein
VPPDPLDPDAVVDDDDDPPELLAPLLALLVVLLDEPHPAASTAANPTPSTARSLLLMTFSSHWFDFLT